jgi:hypothetical protein
MIPVTSAIAAAITRWRVAFAAAADRGRIG